MENKTIGGGILGDEVERDLRRQDIVQALAKDAGAKCRDQAAPRLFSVTWSSTGLPSFTIEQKSNDLD